MPISDTMGSTVDPTYGVVGRSSAGESGTAYGDQADYVAPLSVVGFVKAESYQPNYETIAGRRSNSGFQWQFRLLSGRLSFLATNGSTDSTFSVPADEWKLWSITIDPAGNWRFGFDGAFETYSGRPQIISNPLIADFRIGSTGSGDGTAHVWRGEIASIYIAQRVATDAEILSLVADPFLPMRAAESKLLLARRWLNNKIKRMNAKV